ncbi:MAG: hypothetical protein MUC92_05740 [Fimbriimonadaceae bacterium]|nr:hypothetical protein [Fimbriimonadaceae bacterium]
MEMVAVALGLAMIAQTPAREVTFANGVFTVVGPEGRSIVRTNESGPMDAAATRAYWRISGKDVVFDQRGLTISFAGYSETATYPSVPFNTRLFSESQIAEHRRLTESGERTRTASALSGWVTRGSRLYLLLRWEDRSNRPWLEALVEYDLTQADPAAKVLGRFRGLSTAKGRVNDRLALRGDTLMAVTNTSDGSGIAQFDLRSGESRFQPLPSKVVDGRMIPGSPFGVTFAPSESGGTRVGVIDTNLMSARDAAEIRGSIQGVISPSVLRFLRQGRSILLNLDTGAELDLPRDSGVAAAENGILVWVPKTNPSAAALYTGDQFRTMARWTRPATPSRPATPAVAPSRPASGTTRPTTPPSQRNQTSTNRPNRRSTNQPGTSGTRNWDGSAGSTQQRRTGQTNSNSSQRRSQPAAPRRNSPR